MKYRVSSVESFRQWEGKEDADTDELIARIKGGGESSTAMRAGTAFHKCLELAQDGDNLDICEHDGFRFQMLADIDLVLPPIRELRSSKSYMVDGQPIIISGQVDVIDGRMIEDHKTTARFDPDRFLNGYQWRLYLEIFGADVFRWNVFEIAEKDPGEYDVFAFHRMTQYRYPTLHIDCQHMVERFARFVRDHVEVSV